MFHDWPEHPFLVLSEYLGLREGASNDSLASSVGMLEGRPIGPDFSISYVPFTNLFMLLMIMEHSPVEGDVEWRCLGIDRACERNGSSHTDRFGLQKFFSQ